MVAEETSYCGTGSMPESVRFFLLAGVLAADWDDPSDASSDGAETARRSDGSVSFVSYETDLGEQDAFRLLARLRPLFEAMNDDSRQAVRDSVCVPDLAGWSTAKAMSALDELENVNEAVWQKYYLMARIRLSEKERKALDTLLEFESFSASYVSLKAAEAYKGNPAGAKDKLMRLCRS